MSAVCPSCLCIQPDGVLCSECCAAVQTMLAAVPQLIDQLDVAISKQARISVAGKAGKGTARERSPINFGALAARDALLVELALWGDDIAAIRRHPQAAEIVSGIGKAVKNAYRAIDRMQERQYLGKCMYVEDGLTCHAEIWIKPGAHQVTCTQCETTHDVIGRRLWLLQEAADRLFTVREAAQVIGSYGDLRITESTIRSYVSKGQLGYHGKVAGSSVIRLGDLLEVIRANASATRGRHLRRVS